MRCEDLAYGGSNYQQKMDELAVQAALPGAAWTREHESLVSGLCRGKVREVQRLVADGAVAVDEAQRVASALGKPFRASRRPPAIEGRGTPTITSTNTSTITSTRAQLAELGVCAACADNVAQYVARKPSSACAQLAKRALDGDSRAVDELVDFPDFCRWTYPGARREPRARAPR